MNVSAISERIKWGDVLYRNVCCRQVRVPSVSRDPRAGQDVPTDGLWREGLGLGGCAGQRTQSDLTQRVRASHQDVASSLSSNYELCIGNDMMMDYARKISPMLQRFLCVFMT